MQGASTFNVHVPLPLQNSLNYAAGSLEPVLVQEVRARHSSDQVAEMHDPVTVSLKPAGLSDSGLCISKEFYDL